MSNIESKNLSVTLEFHSNKISPDYYERRIKMSYFKQDDLEEITIYFSRRCTGRIVLTKKQSELKTLEAKIASVFKDFYSIGFDKQIEIDSVSIKKSN